MCTVAENKRYKPNVECDRIYFNPNPVLFLEAFPEPTTCTDHAAAVPESLITTAQSPSDEIKQSPLVESQICLAVSPSPFVVLVGLCTVHWHVSFIPCSVKLSFTLQRLIQE